MLLFFTNTTLFYSGLSPEESPLVEPRSTHDGAVVDAERLQRPGQAQAHQDVKYITAYGVGDGHVSQTWGKESNTVRVCVRPRDKSIMTRNILLRNTTTLNSVSALFHSTGELVWASSVCVCVPWRATITLAMQSGTLVPAARKVMPMMTSGMPSVKPITVTWNHPDFTSRLWLFFMQHVKGELRYF